MSNIDIVVSELCQKATTDRVAPGIVVGYIRDGQRKVLPFGHFRYDKSEPVRENSIFDVASIAKSIPTSTLALRLIEDGELDLDDAVIKFVPEIQNSYREQILVKHLLTYTVIYDIPGGLSTIAKSNPHELLTEMFKAPLMDPPGSRYFYTNPPAILLGLVIERITKRTLDELAADMFAELEMASSMFRIPDDQMPRVVPSEVVDGHELRGVPQDEAARALRADGRCAGDAGLFTTAGDLLTFAGMLLNEGVFKGKRLFKSETVQTMHTNQIASLAAATALGWEIQQPTVMGTRVSNQAFGKTGHTGCNIVIDPVRQAALVILSNRTYPHRETTRDQMNALRRPIADVVFSD